MLAIVSAYDLKYIELEDAIERISKTLETIQKLQKWNGHLYNWYNTETLEPLNPRYVSTVDNGNFIGYLYTAKQFLINAEKNLKVSAPNTSGYIEKINQMIQIIDNIIQSTDFSVLYNPKKRLFSIGFSIEENKLTNSYYDLLASEARQASLVAIAKKDIPSKHWNSLSRTLTSLKKYKGLVSWSGTAFEYLMPNINIEQYEGSLLDEACRFLIMSQMEYAKKLGIPFGISEAAFNLRDLNNNYQYKAFGIPWLGLKRGLEDDMVVSPYSVFLSLNYVPKQGIENLKLLENEGMNSKYGFYESIDYTLSRLKYGKKYETVKTYMAHHQGLSLLSINNLINKNILVKRFMKNPEIEGIKILLQERMPEKAIITKEKKEKAEDKKKEVKPKKSKSKDKATKIEENKDIKDDTKKENIDQNENKTPKAGKRLFAFSLVGGIAVVLIIILAIIFISMAGKPSKAKSEELVKDYLKAVNDDDADEFAKLIDVKGYIIFNEESEKKFDKKYKNKNYINDYLKDNNYDELSDAKDAISSKFKNKYTYSSKEYSLKEITEVKKSTKSKKVKIIKAKGKVKTSYSSSTDTANLKLYVIKVDGEYKIVSAELD